MQHQTSHPSNRLTPIVAGFTTFLTLSYILVVNPSILSTEGTGITFSGALTATVLLGFSMTLLMGVYANLPYAVAPGMGINAFFTYTVILQNQVPWQTALGMVVLSGVLFIIASATPIREKIVEAIPDSLRLGTAVGIGIFLCFIGLQSAGMIQSHPVTMVSMGELNPSTLLSMSALIPMFWLYFRKSAFTFLAAIVWVTIGSFILGQIQVPDSLVAPPDFVSVYWQFDLIDALKLSLLPTIISLFFTDLFDSISTFVGVSEACDLKDEKGRPKNLRQGLLVDAGATLTAGFFGTSSGTAYIESASGIEVGGRDGKTAIVTAFCFLPCLFFAPLFGMVPATATGPVLVFVGFLMFRAVNRITVNQLEDSFPAFLTLVLIPLTFSITQGILWGFIVHTAAYCLRGRIKELTPTLWGLTLLSILLLILEYTQ